MKKLVKYSLFTLVGLLLLTAIPVGYYYNKVTKHPFEDVILAKVKKHGHGGLSNWLADTYLKYGNYDPNGRVTGGAIPYFNYSLYLYQPRHHTQNQRMFTIAKLLLNKGADINAVDTKNGNTALHMAIQQTIPDVVDFLIQHKVDPTKPVNSPGKPWHGMNASQYAKFYMEALKGDKAYPKIVAIKEKVDAYTKVYLTQHASKKSN